MNQQNTTWKDEIDNLIYNGVSIHEIQDYVESTIALGKHFQQQAINKTRSTLKTVLYDYISILEECGRTIDEINKDLDRVRYEAFNPVPACEDCLDAKDPFEQLRRFADSL